MSSLAAPRESFAMPKGRLTPAETFRAAVARYDRATAHAKRQDAKDYRTDPTHDDTAWCKQVAAEEEVIETARALAPTTPCAVRLGLRLFVVDKPIGETRSDDSQLYTLHIVATRAVVDLGI